jgi:hypothetical protein
MFAFASLNFRFSRMLAGLLLAGLLPVAAVATGSSRAGPLRGRRARLLRRVRAPRCRQRGPSRCRHRL